MKLKFAHSAPLQMCVCLVSFLAEVKMFIFCPKTMDYSGVLTEIEVIFWEPFTHRWEVL